MNVFDPNLKAWIEEPEALLYVIFTVQFKLNQKQKDENENNGNYIMRILILISTFALRNQNIS